jgi:hypothetical protein
VRRVVYTASAGVGPYAFTFEILTQTDIDVYIDSTLKTLTTDYTVTINANGTGSITFVTAPTSTARVTIVGARSIERSTDFVTGGDLTASSLNLSLDQGVIFAQQNAEAIGRAIIAPVTDPSSINMVLPAQTSRAGKVLAFNSSTGNPETDITITAIQNAETNATNAAASAAAAAGSASAAASSASNASSSASSASSSASAAAGSASSASSSASAAAASAAAAASSESHAASSESAAASSASAAASSASAASSSASAAAGSASAASTSASNAATSETNAAASAVSAASSAASAAAILDNFDDRYLGAKASDPALDNDGNALIVGALYFNTTDGVMKIYTASGWIAASSASVATLATFEFVATAGQTTFTGADANANTLSYVAPAIIVTLNGARLRPGDDYTATDGVNLVLTSAASLNDELVIDAFGNFEIANVVDKAGDTMTGYLTLNANPVNALHAAPKQYVDSTATSKAVAFSIVFGG